MLAESPEFVDGAAAVSGDRPRLCPSWHETSRLKPETSSRPDQLQRISPQVSLRDLVAQLGFGDHAVLQAAPDHIEEELLLLRVRVGIVGAGELVLAEQGAACAAQPVARGNSWKVSAGR